MKRSLRILFLLLFVTGCASPAPASGPLATPTTLYLVTAPADATPTYTPFQPFDDTPAFMPVAGVATPVPTPLPAENTSTPDPNAVPSTPPVDTGEATATPESFYVPPYAPAPAMGLTDSQTVTFLLLGSDKRPGQTYFRTDTIVIAAVRPDSGQVTLFSVPRDLYVYIPNVGMDRINTAYEYGQMYNYPGGGEALVKDTFLFNLGVRIDYFAIVDFNVFSSMVDTLGGIDVPVSCAYTDWHLIDPNYDPTNADNWALYTVGPGVVHMDGDLALWYARSRQKSSDFDRGRRSQEVLRAIYTRALQTGTISKIPELYNEFSSSVITDANLQTILQLAPLALQLKNANIRSYYIGRDYVSGWMTPGGASVLLPNGPAIQSLIQQALAPSVSLTQDNAVTIEVRNGTINLGWDTLAAERLNYAGFNTRLAPADRQDYAASLFYGLSANPDLNQVGSLLTILGLTPSAFISAPMDSDVPYILIVGNDYQPCFNPNNLAP